MSYKKDKPTVEEYAAYELPYLIMREMRELGMSRQEFAAHIGVSVESLDNYRNGDSLPRYDTFLKIASRLRPEFLLDAIAPAGFGDRIAIIEREDSLEFGKHELKKGL